MSNSLDPDETENWEVSSGSMLFAKAIIIAFDSESVKSIYSHQIFTLESNVKITK